MSALVKVAEAIHAAIHNGDVASLRATLRASTYEKNVFDAVRWEYPRVGNALHVACRKGNVQCIDALLETGVSVNIKQVEGHVVSGLSPLYIACTEGNYEVVKFLLSKGADPNIQESEGQTPLHCAFLSKSLEIVKCLLSHDAEVNKADNSGQSPLQMSILRAPDSISLMLIDAGADVRGADKEGQTPLHYAAEWEKKDVVEYLLSHGSSVNQQDAEGRSPLHVTEDDHVLQLLIAHGGDVNLRNMRGKAPVEKQLDMEQDKYQAINAALSQHSRRTEVRAKQPACNPDIAKQVRERYSRNAMTASAALVDVKSGVHSELLSKFGVESVTEETETSNAPKTSRLAVAGVLDELKWKSSGSKN